MLIIIRLIILEKKFLPYSDTKKYAFTIKPHRHSANIRSTSYSYETFSTKIIHNSQKWIHIVSVEYNKSYIWSLELPLPPYSIEMMTISTCTWINHGTLISIQHLIDNNNFGFNYKPTNATRSRTELIIVDVHSTVVKNVCAQRAFIRVK